MDNININGEEYENLDIKEKVTIADSFVSGSNKIGTGHGERKLYIGNENDETLRFFGKRGFTHNCFLLKTGLIKFLNNSKEEYRRPKQSYQKPEKLSKLWDKRSSMINMLDEFLPFSIEDQSKIKGPRVYINSKDKHYELIREVALPNISYLSVLKLKSKNSKVIYYFKPFIEYFGEDKDILSLKKREEIEKSVIDSDEVVKIIKARIGQGKYRERLLKCCPVCPVTLVSSPEVLIASHIKPWAQSDNIEKIDSKNGFMFSPNVDKLFDRGYITFTNDKIMKVSPWLSKKTYERLNIIPNKRYEKLPIKGREKYLEYHRKNIFEK